MGNYILSHCRFRNADAMLAIFAPVTLPNRYVFIYPVEKTSIETYMISNDRR